MPATPPFHHAPQTYDQQAVCQGEEVGADAVEDCYVRAAQAALLGGLRVDPLLVGLSDAYELCRQVARVQLGRQLNPLARGVCTGRVAGWQACPVGERVPSLFLWCGPAHARVLVTRCLCVRLRVPTVRPAPAADTFAGWLRAMPRRWRGSTPSGCLPTSLSASHAVSGGSGLGLGQATGLGLGLGLDAAAVLEEAAAACACCASVLGWCRGTAVSTPCLFFDCL
jgi:hypothetical protein